MKNALTVDYIAPNLNLGTPFLTCFRDLKTILFLPRKYSIFALRGHKGTTVLGFLFLFKLV